MDVTPLVKVGSKIIQSYSGQRFKISNEIFKTPVIVTPNNVRVWACDAKDASPLTAKDISQLKNLEGEVDVVLLGVGAKMAFPSRDIRQAYQKFSFSVDVMDTGAACRTYNVLMAEGRRVATALLLF